jgi:hypothetical protein
MQKITIRLVIFGVFCFLSSQLHAQKTLLQRTQVKGFVHFNFQYDIDEEKPSFQTGEQDIFITSEVSDKLTFLGESVIRYTSDGFQASIERIVLKYNYYGNHNILAGKHHTPINYWNDTYHHGRVFFPTIGRPVLFAANIIPIHTTGISFQGQNLTKLKFGYDVMFGNGISSGDSPVNSNNSLSTTLSAYIKPIDGMRFGLTAYFDEIDADDGVSNGHHSSGTPHEAIDQQIYTAYFAYFGNKIEFLTEGSLSYNKGKESGTNQTISYYAYLGYPIGNTSLTPYLRYDLLRYEENEVFYNGDDTDVAILGLRYEINYRAVVKLEYQFFQIENVTDRNLVKAQIAIGF